MSSPHVLLPQLKTYTEIDLKTWEIVSAKNPRALKEKAAHSTALLPPSL
jgi:hypothetical protein